VKILITSILGGIFISDATAVGQFMISRPLFCGPVIGYIMGDIVAGLYVGIIIELLWITAVPLGNAVPPDSTVVTIIAAYLAAVSGNEYGAGYIMFLLLFCIPVGILFRKLDMIHREFNSFFSRELEHKIDEGSISYIDKITYLSVLLFILKGAVFIFVFLLLGERIFPFVYSLIPADMHMALTKTMKIVPSIGLGIAITSFLFKRTTLKRRT
jgi:mannose/fructose/N-acetylgalactosamine-specific phosphotransferase system component IIC